MKTSLICALLLTAFANVGQCSTVTLATPVGATFSGNPVDFEAIITTSLNSIVVVLESLQDNPTADTQEISGISFTLNTVDSNATTLSSSSGQLINIASGGVWTNDTTDSINHWQVSGSAGSTSTVIALNVFSGGQPNDLIIGNPNSNNLYATANNSITGHQPSIKNSGTFTLSMVGITSATTVTTASFNVGTTISNVPVNAVVATPEPASILLTSLAFLPLYAFRRRKKA